MPSQDIMEEKLSMEILDTGAEDMELSGQFTLPNGNVIDRSSAAFLNKSKKDHDDEDEYNYTERKIQRKYAKCSQQQDGTVHYVCINKGTSGLGISLAGHKDRSKMSVYICGLNPQGNAFRDGRMKVGDLILEVNGRVVHHRHHLNVSSLVKSLPDAEVTFVVLRTKNGTDNLAVKPVIHFPQEPYKDNPIERYKGRYKGLREISIHRGTSSLGIMLIEGKHSEAGVGVFVSDYQDGSCAAEAGIRRGDMILAVNGEDFVGVNYDAAAVILKKAGGVIKMVVANPLSTTPSQGSKKEFESPAAPVPESKNTPSRPQDTEVKTDTTLKIQPQNPKQKSVISPAKCQVTPGEDVTIDIIKDKDDAGNQMGLGISIVGGNDTVLGAVFIQEIYEKGAAHKDNRLKQGDQILEIMGNKLHDVSHVQALQALRQTPNRVRLVVRRESDEIYENLDIELLKKKERGLGLSIVGKKSGPGVFISEVVKGGTADLDGRLVQGDQIIAVNEHDLTDSLHEDAAPILKMVSGKVKMRIRRLKVGRRPRKAVQVQSNLSNSTVTKTMKLVVLKRDESGLGFSIVGGTKSPHGDLPIYVKTVFDSGPAADHGGLKRGDVITSVNGLSLEGATHQNAVNILKNCEEHVTLHILPS